jgi:type IV secretory pathway VirB2 component (pilin)
MKKILLLSTFTVIIGSLFFLSPIVVSPVNAIHCGDFVVHTGTPPCSPDPSAPPGGLDPSDGNQTFPNPLGDTEDYVEVVGNVVKTILGVVGVLALVIFIYGGITWMTSLGNMERVKLGRDTLVWATIGLVVVFASFSIVNLILSSFKA